MAGETKERVYVVTTISGSTVSSTAPGELALGDSHRQAVGTMSSYLLVVSGVNPVGETKVNTLWLCGPAWRGGRGARPHNHTKIRGKRYMKTIRLLLTRLALGPRRWSCITSRIGVALGRRQDTPELEYGLGSHRARCGEAVVNQ